MCVSPREKMHHMFGGVVVSGWGKKYKHGLHLTKSMPKSPIYLSRQALILSNQYWAITCFLLRLGTVKFKNFSPDLYVESHSSEINLWFGVMIITFNDHEKFLPRIKMGESWYRLSIPPCLTTGMEPRRSASHVRWQSSPFPINGVINILLIGLKNIRNYCITWWR